LGESAQVRVTLADGRRVEAAVLSSDPWSDLAVVKLEGERAEWPALPLAEAGSVTQSQQVVAIGYSPALPESPSVTTGLATSLIGTGEPGAGSQLIHTSAPIFPGYSGGPLLDLKGQVVGIDTALVMGDGPSNPNQGLSISMATARPVIDALLNNESQQVRWLGFIPYTITPELRRLNDLGAEKGIVIVSIFGDSPAARAGLRKGDTIVAAQGQPIAQVGDLLNVLAQVPAGSEVELEVVDLVGGRHLLRVSVEDRPSVQSAAWR
jgi:S1-C subfamily serine protease